MIKFLKRIFNMIEFCWTGKNIKNYNIQINILSISKNSVALSVDFIDPKKISESYLALVGDIVKINYTTNIFWE